MIERYFENCVARLDREKIPVAGMCLLDDGGTALCEHRWTRDRARNLNSNTKSYTGLAVGMAIGEGKLSLSDRLVDAFPECLPENPSPGLEQITLRHLLTMSSGFHKGLLMEPARRRGVGMPDYVSYMCAQPVKKQPGSEYHYSTGDSILAARMCEKATGEGLPLFLYKRFFSKADIPYPVWEHCPMGHACGGAGLHLNLMDMAKLGLLCLNDGVWRGERLVDSAWIREATKAQIPIFNDDLWESAYGYQFKIMPFDGAYYACGAFGQETVVLSRQGLVLAIQCPEIQSFDAAKRVIHEELLCNLCG